MVGSKVSAGTYMLRILETFSLGVTASCSEWTASDVQKLPGSGCVYKGGREQPLVWVTPARGEHLL